jgi:hypothetical protein
LYLSGVHFADFDKIDDAKRNPRPAGSYFWCRFWFLLGEDYSLSFLLRLLDRLRFHFEFLRFVYTQYTNQKGAKPVKSILFTFENDTDRDQFLQVVKEAADRMIKSDDVPDGYTERAKNGALIQKTLDTIKLDPPVKADHERQCGIWVSGQKLKEGPLDELNKMFNQEIAAHSANVELRELRGGDWNVIRSRRRQA